MSEQSTKQSPATMSQWLVVVPARLDSQRLPRKALADLGGRPLIARVVDNLAPLRDAGARIIVATDASEIVDVCRERGIEAELTSRDHPSGTDRCHEVAIRHDRAFVMNVQGDEPFIDPTDVMSLARSVEARPDADIGTLVFPSSDRDAFLNPNVVKALRAANGWALAFSRAPIPFGGDRSPRLGDLRDFATPDVQFLHHLGVYAFRVEALRRFCALAPSPLEGREKLEQMRALDNGMRVWLTNASRLGIGIDTPADLEAARARF